MLILACTMHGWLALTIWVIVLVRWIRKCILVVIALLCWCWCLLKFLFIGIIVRRIITVILTPLLSRFMFFFLCASATHDSLLITLYLEVRRNGHHFRILWIHLVTLFDLFVNIKCLLLWCCWRLLVVSLVLFVLLLLLLLILFVAYNDLSFL